MRRLILILSIFLLSAGSASAQFLNVGRLANVFRSVEKVFDNNNTPWTFVGTTVPAINYDLGGQGIAVSSWNPVGCGGPGNLTYRPDANLMFLDASDVTEQFSLGCLKVGDYAKYIVNFTGAGPYTIKIAVSNTQVGASWQILLDSVPLPFGNLTVPNTGGFQTFSTVVSPSFNATPQNHTLTFKVASAGTDGFAGNFNWFQGATAGTGGNVSVVTLTNGPPNIPYAAVGAVTPTAGTWIPANMPTGSPVSDVYADLVPMSSNYTGSFSLSGPGSGSFSISTSSDGTRNVGHITTSGTIGVADYDVTVCAAPTCSVGASQSQRITVHAASGTAVACGSSVTVQNAANAAGNGATLLFPACTYTWTTSVKALTNQTWVGVPGRTIFDAGGTASLVDTSACGDTEMVCGFNAGTTGVTLANLTFQHFLDGTSQPAYCGDPNPACTRGTDVATNDGWTIRNSTFNGIVTGGATQWTNGTVTYVNNVFNHIGAGAIGGGGSYVTGGTVNVIGNEFGDMNYIPVNSCNGSGNKWLYNSFTLNEKNNYYHDVNGPGLWFDSFNSQTYSVTGDTYVRIGAPAIEDEQQHSQAADFSFNVFSHVGDGSKLTGQIAQCGGEGQAWPAVIIQGSANTNVHDNNFNLFNAGKNGGQFYFTDEIGNGAGSVANNTVHDNTVNVNYGSTNDFFSSWGWETTSECTGGDCANNGSFSRANHYHLVGGNTGSDTHWFWFNQGNNAQTFSSYRASGQDSSASGTTIDTTAIVATGCTHVACSGSGVGAGGVPQQM